MFHVMKQVWNITSSFFSWIIFSPNIQTLWNQQLQSSACHSWKILGGLKFTSTLLNIVQLFVQKGTIVLDKSSGTW